LCTNDFSSNLSLSPTAVEEEDEEEEEDENRRHEEGRELYNKDDDGLRPRLATALVAAAPRMRIMVAAMLCCGITDATRNALYYLAGRTVCLFLKSSSFSSRQPLGVAHLDERDFCSGWFAGSKKHAGFEHRIAAELR
jgi:hypothetical protein